MTVNRVQTKIITTALDEEDKLSDWESQFINDLAEKPEGYELSDKQNDILNRIHKKLDY